MSTYKYDTSTSLRSVTPSDDNDLPDGVCRALWVSTDGDVEIIAEDDDAEITLAAATAGTLLPVRVKRVLTGTTSTVVALY